MFSYGSEKVEMHNYLMAGKELAYKLNNRGPIKFNDDGSLDKNIIDSYEKNGFYIFKNVFSKVELNDCKNDYLNILKKLPVSSTSRIDSKGRAAITVDCKANILYWSKPLADPFGGTELANGRHPVKMIEPRPNLNSPKEIIYLTQGFLQFSDTFMVAYAHPLLLKVAENINGIDFVPFTEGYFIKEPELGASVAWHQDGTTHWNNPNWDQHIHGFNFMAQLYKSTPGNGVWVVPGTHKLGKIDIKKRVYEAGTERLPDAVPIVCDPGDVAITNRQVLHCSFANTSLDRRVTINYGFHKRSSVLNVLGGGLHGKPKVYDKKHVIKRSRLIQYAISARSQKYPNETPYIYKPLINEKNKYIWNEKARKDIKDYSLMDMSI